MVQDPTPTQCTYPLNVQIFAENVLSTNVKCSQCRSYAHSIFSNQKKVKSYVSARPFSFSIWMPFVKITTHNSTPQSSASIWLAKSEKEKVLREDRKCKHSSYPFLSSSNKPVWQQLQAWGTRASQSLIPSLLTPAGGYLRALQQSKSTLPGTERSSSIACSLELRGWGYHF